MKIAIIGSRNLKDVRWIEEKLTALRTLEVNEPVVFLLGGAAGTQEIAMDYAINNNIDYVLFKPWHLVDPKRVFSPRYFFMRNKQIIDNANAVFIIKDDIDDSEVDRAVSYAKKKNKALTIVEYHDK